MLSRTSLFPRADRHWLPDWWELLYCGSPTGCSPDHAPDGDGLSNLEEYLHGTRPHQFSIVVNVVRAVGSGRAQWVTQTFDLRAGWNAVHVTFQPEPRNCDLDYQPVILFGDGQRPLL